MKRQILLKVALLGMVGLYPCIAHANDAATKAQASIDKGLAFLKQQQKEDGGWHNEGEPPAISAIVLRSFITEANYPASTDFVKKGYEKLLSYQLEDGGIYKDLLANYNTAIAISALAAAREPAFQARLDKAVAYLRTLQWTDTIAGLPKNEKVSGEDDPRYGGFGYGRKSRPDGSNLQMALDALHDAGVPKDDPAYQRALKFVTRMQNYSETNDQAWTGNDGGFVYTPAGGTPEKPGETFAGEYEGPDGKRMLRSYGSMTYAGLKSYIYAGLTKDDPRVKAAWAWISANWTLEENPGMRAGDPANAQHGLYYYFYTLSRALNVYDEPILKTPEGKDIDWRLALIEKLTSLQNEDGSWIGDKKWMEDNAQIATSYTVQALQGAVENLKKNPAK